MNRFLYIYSYSFIRLRYDIAFGIRVISKRFHRVWFILLLFFDIYFISSSASPINARFLLVYKMFLCAIIIALNLVKISIISHEKHKITISKYKRLASK